MILFPFFKRSLLISVQKVGRSESGKETGSSEKRLGSNQVEGASDSVGCSGGGRAEWSDRCHVLAEGPGESLMVWI